MRLAIDRIARVEAEIRERDPEVWKPRERLELPPVGRDYARSCAAIGWPMGLVFAAIALYFAAHVVIALWRGTLP